jgi:hypothetical protein
MATKIAAMTDNGLVNMLLEIDQSVSFLDGVQDMTGHSMADGIRDLRKVQQAVNEEIGHRTVIGKWKGVTPPHD